MFDLTREEFDVPWKNQVYKDTMPLHPVWGAKLRDWCLYCITRSAFKPLHESMDREKFQKIREKAYVKENNKGIKGGF